MVEQVKPFTEINYVTSAGENCKATKNNGIVTVIGDKNGIRQIPEKEFLQDFIKDQVKKGSLEKSPQNDTVSFSSSYQKEEKENKNNVQNAIFAGLAVALAGTLIYFLTGGRAKIKTSDVEKAANNVTQTTKKASAESVNITASKAENTSKNTVGMTKESDTATKVEQTVSNPAEENVAETKTSKKKNGLWLEAIAGASAAGVAAKESGALEKATAKIGDEIVTAGGKAANELFGKEAAKVEKATSSAIVDDSSRFAENELIGENKINLSDDIDDLLKTETSGVNKGAYGQDLDDPFDPMNEYDILSPYYGRKQREEDDLLAESLIDNTFINHFDDGISMLDDGMSSFGDDLIDLF